MKTYLTISNINRAAITLTMAVCCVQPTLAGTEGTWADSTGRGVMANNIVFKGTTANAASGVTTYPCSEVAYRQTAFCSGVAGSSYTGLPYRTPTSVYCRGTIGANFVINVSAYVSGGATADNALLQSKFDVRPVECATVTASTTADYFDDFSGEITLNTKASEGTAIGFVGYELPLEVRDEDGNIIPMPTDPERSKAFLIENGKVVFELFLKGPFDYDDAGNPSLCKALKIPFSTTGGITQLVMTTDTLALSTPFEVTFPEDMTVACGQTFEYTPTVYTGLTCDDVSVSYSPLESELGVGTTTVTATVLDANNEVLEVGEFQVTKTYAIVCPDDQVVSCGSVFQYPVPQIPGNCLSYHVNYSIPASDLPLGTTPVTATLVEDSSGDILGTCTFNVSIFSEFIGFESPISGSSESGTGGSFDHPIKKITGNRDLPIKFSETCNGLPIFEAVPPVVKIYKVTLNADGDEVPEYWFEGQTELLNVTSDVYHVNVDTSTMTPGIYKVTAELGDGRVPYAYIKR